MKIAPEGRSLIALGLVVSIVFCVFYLIFPRLTIAPPVVCACLTMGLIYFFRDPIRTPPKGVELILSPADGTVLSIEESESTGKTGEIMLSIFLSLFDAHINRCPVSGVVEKIEYQKGRCLPAFLKCASKKNEMNRISFNCSRGLVVIQQVAGMVARRVVCHLKEGDTVTAGERLGIIKFGSRVDLILPKNIEIKVKPGDRVKAGLSVIGVWLIDEKN